MKKKLVVTSVAVLLLIIGLVVAFDLWTADRKAQTFSCASSISAKLMRNENIILQIRSVDSDWKVLSTAEYDRLMAQLPAEDCKGTVDNWGNRYEIAVRREKEGIKNLVWSKGPDGIRRTKDDIVVPFGESIPPLKE